MQAVYHSVRTAATSKATIFISGESGTGKEVCAEAIHLGSTRAHKPFVAINCAAIPKDLVELEIFGHVKGAFTGAVAHRVGAAAQAHRGTLFLDEICEMDLQLQSKLLRFLQTGTLRRVGASEDEKVDVRVICATNRDPLVEIAAGRFREDLYYRLHVVAIHLPPLRERGPTCWRSHARSWPTSRARRASGSCGWHHAPRQRCWPMHGLAMSANCRTCCAAPWS